jgi:hypothetical protein
MNIKVDSDRLFEESLTSEFGQKLETYLYFMLFGIPVRDSLLWRSSQNGNLDQYV